VIDRNPPNGILTANGPRTRAEQIAVISDGNADRLGTGEIREAVA
jgi:hypothetical protein